MKVLYIHTLYTPHIAGGAEISVQTLAESMAARGHDVAVLTIGPCGALSKETINGVTVYRAGYKNLYFHHTKSKPPALARVIWHWKDRNNRGMIPSITQCLTDFRPDIVSTHNLVGFSRIAWRLVREAGIPLVHVLHDLYLLCARSTMFRNSQSCATRCLDCRAFRAGHQKASRSVNAVVGVSTYIRRRHIDDGFFATAQQVTIYNARSGGMPQERKGRINPSLQTFGFIGTLAPHKGIETLLETFSATKHVTWRLRIAGTGDPEYVAALKQSYRDQRITFLGHIPARDFFPTIDASIVPSLWHDTLPGVVFESLAHGVPVIGTSLGGTPEMISHGKNGFIFNPRDTQQLSESMEKLTDDVRLMAMSKNAQQSAKPFYDTERWTREYELLYGRLLRTS